MNPADWTTQVRLVLDCVTQAFDIGAPTVDAAAYAAELGLTAQQVSTVMADLGRAGLLEAAETEPGHWHVQRVCPLTRQLLNVWPPQAPASRWIVHPYGLRSAAPLAASALNQPTPRR